MLESARAVQKIIEGMRFPGKLEADREAGYTRPPIANLNDATVDDLSGKKLFAAVEIADSSNLEETVRKLIVVDERFALIFFESRNWHHQQSGQSILTRYRDIMELQIIDRDYGPGVNAFKGNESLPGTAWLVNQVISRVQGNWTPHRWVREEVYDNETDQVEMTFLPDECVPISLAVSESEIGSGRTGFALRLRAWPQQSISSEPLPPGATLFPDQDVGR